MLYLLANAGLQSGLTISFLKLFGEIIQAHKFAENQLLAWSLGLMMIASSVFQAHSINLAMKYYDQLEVMPIFQAMIMIMWILGGMVVLQEAQFYSWGQLGGIAASFFVCCIGIYLLVAKIKTQRRETKQRRSRSKHSRINSGMDHSINSQ